ncbi:SfiI family type II restriction endonuclease [Streptomyces sp. NPDC051896]|uniref:SfiI family type II restriction endonuclease n=1 Tax=Streptomyces sp. NPDC051896 TaxID=3155416 RepID=UPI003429B1CE
MKQDYRDLSLDEIELIEKQTLRTIVQAVQQYSREAKQIFETTAADSPGEIIVLAEDLTQYALEVAELYPINKRFAGFIDYKRARWLPTPYGLIPQALLVDAKASKENFRETLQRSQLPMDAEFRKKTTGEVVQLPAGVLPHLPIESANGGVLPAISTSIFVHFHYKDAPAGSGIHRELKGIYVLAIPHGMLKPRYNPNPDETIFGEGKHSPARAEDARIRVYYKSLRTARPWRLQELLYANGANGYTQPLWRDEDAAGMETTTEFLYLER